MNKEFYKPELLAPAGSMEALKASVNAGADAVYMGGKMFGARAFADNPDTDGLKEALEFCHLRNKKLYLTVNTLLKDEEIKQSLFDYLKPLFTEGLDAVIVQDIGVMRFISECFPKLDIHVSTQCSLTMAEGAEAIRSLLPDPCSITRVVPARELSFEELSIFRKNTDLEMEVFIHGALCYCYSGRCLLSSLAGGRSGNRGRCAQPCRKLYKTEIEGENFKGYFLSPKDMCTLDHIGKLIDIGIDSFKIEGRMKSPEYAAGVVEAYRKAIDDHLMKKGSESGELKDRVSEIYNRGGFNTGYLFKHNGQDMMSTLRPGHNGTYVGNIIKVSGRKAEIFLEKDVSNGDVLEIRDENDISGRIYEFTCGSDHKSGDTIEILTMKDRTAARGHKVYRTKNRALLNELDEKYVKKDMKCPVDIKLNCCEGKDLELEFSAFGKNGKEISVKVNGSTVQKAINSASGEDALKTQISKLGNTDFLARNVSVIKDGDVFVPVGELNRLRRCAAENLRESILNGYKRESDPVCMPEKKDLTGSVLQKNITGDIIFTARISSVLQLRALLGADTSGIINEIYYPMDDTADEVINVLNGTGKILRFVFPPVLREEGKEKTLAFVKKYGDKVKYLATNYESLGIVRKAGVSYRTDFSLYVFNRISKSIFGDHMLSPELNSSEIKVLADKNSEVLIYGLIPVMHSAQCVYKTVTGKCKKHGPVRIKDEKGYAFTVLSDCENCINTVCNSAVLNLIGRYGEVKDTGCGRMRLDFTLEDENEIRMVLTALENAVKGKDTLMADEIMGMRYTNGHFARGVE